MKWNKNIQGSLIFWDLHVYSNNQLLGSPVCRIKQLSANTFQVLPSKLERSTLVAAQRVALKNAIKVHRRLLSRLMNHVEQFDAFNENEII